MVVFSIRDEVPNRWILEAFSERGRLPESIGQVVGQVSEKINDNMPANDGLYLYD